MKLNKMTLEAASAYLELELVETPEGLIPFHEKEDDDPQEEVTLEDAKKEIAESKAAFERLKEANYEPAVHKIVEKFLIDSVSSWTTIQSHLKSLQDYTAS